MVIARLFINEVDRFCKMKSIGHHDPGMMILYFDEYRIICCQGVDVFTIYDHSHIQNTQEYLLFPADDDIILGFDTNLFQ